MKWLFFTIWLFILVAEILSQNTRFNERYSWRTLNFQFPDEQSRQRAINSRDYIPINNVPLGTEIWRNRFFVTVPRWLTGIASTLNFFTINNTGKRAFSPVRKLTWFFFWAIWMQRRAGWQIQLLCNQ